MLCTCGQCRLCWLRENRPEYAEKFGAATVGNGSVALVRMCKWIGVKVKPDCHCTERICTLGLGNVRHLVECQTCERYELPQL